MTEHFGTGYRSFKILASRIIAHPAVGWAVGRLYGDVIPFHGLGIDVRGSGLPDANKAALRWGLYESAECRFVRRYLRPDLPTFELGSSIGAVSSMIASRLRPGTRLTCVEGNPRVIPCLERNLATHARHLRVDVVNAAVAYDVDRVGFDVADDNLVSRVAEQPTDTTVTVPGVTLQSLVSPLPDGGYQLVADIEGAEAAVLMRDGAVLQRCRNLIIELHSTTHAGRRLSCEDLVGMLRDAGFVVVERWGAVVACRRGDAA